MKRSRYTKADLEELVYFQLENLKAMHALLSIMKVQNEQLNNVNKTLKDGISEFKEKHFIYQTGKRNTTYHRPCWWGDLALWVLRSVGSCVRAKPNVSNVQRQEFQIFVR